MTGQARIVEILLDFNYPCPSVQDVPQWIEMDALAPAWTASLLIHQLALLQGDQYQEHLPRYKGAKEKQALMNMDKKIIDTNHHNIIMNERVVLVTSDKVWILMLACSLSNTAELDAVRIWHSCRDNADWSPCQGNELFTTAAAGRAVISRVWRAWRTPAHYWWYTRGARLSQNQRTFNM